MNQQDTTNSADVESFKDDPIEVVRCLAAVAVQHQKMTPEQRKAEPHILDEWSPLAIAAQRICVLNGYASDGNELPGFMERAALRELEANPTKELRALNEALLPEPSSLTPERIDAIMANSFPHTKPTAAYRKFARDIEREVLDAAPALSPEQIHDLAVRAGVKGSAAALAEFAALVREAQPLAPEEMRPAAVAVPDDEAAPAPGNINLNTTFTATLTETGAKIHNDFYAWMRAEYPDHAPSLASGGTILKDQLWHLMEIFGPHITMGMPEVPFVGNEIRCAAPVAAHAAPTDQLREAIQKLYQAVRHGAAPFNVKHTLLQLESDGVQISIDAEYLLDIFSAGGLIESDGSTEGAAS